MTTTPSVVPAAAPPSPPEEDAPRPGTQELKAGQAALHELLAPVRPILFVGQGLAVVSSALSIAPFIALVRAGDVLFTAFRRGTAPAAADIEAVIKWLVGAFLGQLTFYFLALLVCHFADLKLVSVLRERLISSLAHAPLSWFSSTTSGKVRKAVDDDTLALHSLVAHAPVDAITAVLTPLLLLGYALYVDWRLGLLAVATIPVYFVIQAYSMKDMGPKTARMDAYLGEVSSTAAEFAEGIAVVKAFGTVGKAHARFVHAADSFADFYLAWVGPLMRLSALSESFVSLPVLVLINAGGGAALVNSGAVTPAEVIATTLIALILPGTIQQAGMMVWSHQLAGAAALRLRDLIHLSPLPVAENDSAAADSQLSQCELRVEDVSFAYDTRPVLRGVSFALRPGTVTALVGPSGSGKSTLATMLARFQDPTSGRITSDGVDLRDLSTAQLYARITFVLQDPQLIRASVRDNIALARPHASDEEVWAAARAASIAADIAALPNGLDTVLDTDVALSGGQAQRIAIARAMLANAPILVLDEATAAIDPDCEADIQAALTRLVRGKTVLVIAHKPESIRGVDQIIALRDGCVVEEVAGDGVTPATIDRIMGYRPATRNNPMTNPSADLPKKGQF